MKTKLILGRQLAMLSTAVCAVTLALSDDARANSLSFSDIHVVGTASPGAPADPADVASYINFMIALPLGGSGSFSGETIARSNNVFGSLPQALSIGAVSGTGTTVNLGSSGFIYLFAKYDGQNDNSLVWDVAGLTGIYTIPADGPLGHGLSGWILFDPTNVQAIPDGGSTFGLLGLALAALVGASRIRSLRLA